MPTASRESSRSRRSNSRAKSPPPSKAPPPPAKKVVNGVKNNIAPKSTKESNSSKPQASKDGKLIDFQTDVACRLCEKKNFKAGSEALVKHYALEHFKEKLDLEIAGSSSKDFSCNICKNKKLKSKFETRQDLLLHNATFHSRVQTLLSENLDEKPGSGSNNINNTNNSNNINNIITRRRRVLNRGRHGRTSSDSIIEIDCTSDAETNGVEEKSDGSVKSTDIEEVEVEDDDEIEFKDVNDVIPTSSNSSKSLSNKDQENKKKEMWVVDKKSKTKTETWFVNKEVSTSLRVNSEPSDEVIEVIDLDEEEEDSGNDTETESRDDTSISDNNTVLGAQHKSSIPANTPKTLEEFQAALKDNLRTKDGAYCVARDEKNIECVCGKVIKVCNNFYWRYMVQKPRIQNGKIVSRGHWFNCDEVKRRGTDFVMDEREIEDLKHVLANGGHNNLKRADAGDREDCKPKRMRTREKKISENISEDDDEEARQMIIQRNIAELLESRVVNETFIQDGPCFYSAADLAWCRECRLTPVKEREDILLRGGKFAEDDSNITCSFYSFRKLRMTKQGDLAVAGYLDPNTDPKPEELRLWNPDKTQPPLGFDVEKTKYILSLIGDQFCQMVQQERRCVTVHMGANKTVAWKKSVRGVREMCDVCKTTLFNHHWICSSCGLFVCLDCYQTRRGGLVKDVADRTTDDYKWPYCTNNTTHSITNLMLTTIIPSNCLIDLAKKVHHLRAKWKIPQFCHQPEELQSLYTQDDGFLSLQSVSFNNVNSLW